MKVLASPGYGPLSRLAVSEVPEPSPGAGEVRVRVVASALNPADYKVVTGAVKFLHARNKPLVVGYDFSGTVDAVGAGVSDLEVGAEVFGFLPYGPFNRRGAFAECLVAPRAELARKPASVSHERAAAAATTGLTALQAFRDQGRAPASGARVLVTGVSGGVGSIAIGVARKLGATVTAVGSGAGLDAARGLGATEVLDRTQRTLPGELATKFHVVLDAAAAYRWSAWRGTLEPGGTFVTTLPSGAFFADTLKSVFASTRVKMVNVKSRAADLELLGTWLADGLEVPLAATIPVRDVAAGLERLQRGGGRIAVQVAGNF